MLGSPSRPLLTCRSAGYRRTCSAAPAYGGWTSRRHAPLTACVHSGSGSCEAQSRRRTARPLVSRRETCTGQRAAPEKGPGAVGSPTAVTSAHAVSAADGEFSCGVTGGESSWQRIRAALARAEHGRCDVSVAAVPWSASCAGRAGCRSLMMSASASPVEQRGCCCVGCRREHSVCCCRQRPTYTCGHCACTCSVELSGAGREQHRGQAAIYIITGPIPWVPRPVALRSTVPTTADNRCTCFQYG